VLVAYLAVEALPLIAPAELPRAQDIALDARVLAFVALVAGVTALAFAAVSGLSLGRAGSATALGGGRAAGSVTGTRTRAALLVAELALSLMLLIGVALMVRSFANLAAVDSGFDIDNVTTIQISLVDSHFPYSEPSPIADFYRRVSEEVAALPGVEAAGATSYLPSLSRRSAPYAYDTLEGTSVWGATSADYRHVTPGWMEAIGARLLAGRFFDARDDLEHPNAVIVDDKLAAAAWPGDDALGRRLQVEVFVRGSFTPVWAEVVGVVQHMRHGPAGEGGPQVFLPHAQSPMRTTVLTVRTTGDTPPGLGEAVAGIVQRLDGDQPIGVALPMSTWVDQTLAARRFALTLLSIFATLALALAVVGTYGVIAYGVSRRRREIGIQLAIGATPARVVRAIVLAGARLGALGIALGTAGAALLSRFLAGVLYGVAPTDPATFAAAGALMALVTLAACWLPARRAARLDPTLALRSE